MIYPPNDGLNNVFSIVDSILDDVVCCEELPSSIRRFRNYLLLSSTKILASLYCETQLTMELLN
jgi:hypothetical protein